MGAIKYTEYKDICALKEVECFVEYLGEIVDINGAFNIYNRLKEIGDKFDFESVHSVEKVNVSLDTDRNLIEIAGGYAMCGLELSNEAICEMRKAFKHWNDKYGLTYYVPTENVVDIRDEIDNMIKESTEYIYSI